MPAAITARRRTNSTGLTRSARSVRWPSILLALEAEAAVQGRVPKMAAVVVPRARRPQPPDRKPPKVISPSDPSSAWTAKANKRVQFGYGLNYLIDIENAVIVDVEATPARTYDEVAATKTMIDRTEQRLRSEAERLAADTAYGTGKFLGWLVKEEESRRTSRCGRRSHRRTASSPARDFTGTRGGTSISAPTANCLRTTGTVHDGRVRNYLLTASRLPRLHAQASDARARRARRSRATSMRMPATCPARKMKTGV